MCDAAFATSALLRSHEAASHTPNGTKSPLKKQKEAHFEEFLTSRGIAFDKQHYVDLRSQGKTRAFPDFHIPLTNKYGKRIICITELDEHQHSRWGYTVRGDLERMAFINRQLRVIGRTEPIVWIRLNPDSFTVGGQRVKVSLEERYSTFLQLLATLQSSESLPQESVHYLFYSHCTSSAGPRLEIQSDPSFGKEFERQTIVHQVGVTTQNADERDAIEEQLDQEEEDEFVRNAVGLFTLELDSRWWTGKQWSTEIVAE